MEEEACLTYEVEIYYCNEWNFQGVAAGLAEELKENLGIEAKLIEDRDGIFDVFVDESLVFSLSEAGRFPQPGEITAMFNQ